MADISGFFNKIGKTVGKAVDKTAETVGDAAQKGKYKVEISKYNGQIRDTQEELGKAIIEAKLAGKENEELMVLIDEAHNKVLNLKDEIARVEEQIAQIGGDNQEVSDSCCEDEAESCCCSSEKVEEKCCCESETVEELAHEESSSCCCSEEDKQE